MEELATDPIIAFYMKMSTSTNNDGEVPLYSETMLRLSFKEIFGANRPQHPEELALYRKLILFHFSENYMSISDLVEIMTCFTETEIRELLDNHYSILEIWRDFRNEYLASFIYKDALNEMLYEYTRRYMSVFGKFEDHNVKQKADEIQRFLNPDSKMSKQWLRGFSILLRNRLKQHPIEYNTGLTTQDLDLHSIYNAVKNKLNIYLVADMDKKIPYKSKTTTSYLPPSAKRQKRNDLNTVKTLDIQVVQPADDVDDELSRELSVRDNDSSDESNYDTDVPITAAQQQTEIETENRTDSEEFELQNVEIVQEDIPSEESEIMTTDDEDDVDDDNDVNAEDGKCNNDVGENKNGGIIDNDTAMSYLSALQAYAVVNGHFEAIGLLDKVDSLFRVKRKM